MVSAFKEYGFSTLLGVDPTPRLRSVRAARAALLKMHNRCKNYAINAEIRRCTAYLLHFLFTLATTFDYVWLLSFFQFFFSIFLFFRLSPPAAHFYAAQRRIWLFGREIHCFQLFSFVFDFFRFFRFLKLRPLPRAQIGGVA